MANILEVQAETRQRSGTSSVRRLRREGLVPAVLYGNKVENANLKVDAKTIGLMLRDASSENILVNLKIDGAKKDQVALIQKVQHDYLKGGILHIDFHAVNMDEAIHAQVPIEVVGTAVGVKAGGQLDLLLHTLEVHCVPKDLPEKLEVDVTHIELGQAFHISDLKLPEGVSVHMDGEVVVLIVSEPRVAEETETAAAPATAPAAAAAPAADS